MGKRTIHSNVLILIHFRRILAANPGIGYVLIPVFFYTPPTKRLGVFYLNKITIIDTIKKVPILGTLDSILFMTLFLDIFPYKTAAKILLHLPLRQSPKVPACHIERSCTA